VQLLRGDFPEGSHVLVDVGEDGLVFERADTSIDVDHSISVD
jgi:hypothetical protein